MLNNLRSSNVRRLLYIASAALVVVAVVLRYLLGAEDEGFSQTARELASNVAGAVIVWALGIIFLGFVFAKEAQSHETEVIDGDASAKRFLRSASEASIWFHHGQIGRWVRENALPALVARSARSPEPLRMVVVLLDPRAHEACKNHAARRNSRRRKESNPFDAESIKSESVSTILALAKAQAAVSNFEATTYVSDLDLPFRLDLCNDYGYITHEDQTAPAFGFEKDSPYYATACGYFDRLNLAQFRKIDLSKVHDTISGLDTASLTSILSKLELDFPEASNADVAAKIVSKVNKIIC